MSNQDTLTPAHPQELSEKLRAFQAEHANQDLSVGTLLGIQGDSALSFILILLAIPALLPSTGIPFASIFSVGLFAVATAMLMGANHVQLPQKLNDVRLSAPTVAHTLSLLIRFYTYGEKITQARLYFLTGQSARRYLSAIVYLMAFIILLPIPFGNTAPAFVLIILGVGLAFHDGLVVMVAAMLSLGALGLAIWLGGLATEILASFF